MAELTFMALEKGMLWLVAGLQCFPGWVVWDGEDQLHSCATLSRPAMSEVHSSRCTANFNTTCTARYRLTCVDRRLLARWKRLSWCTQRGSEKWPFASSRGCCDLTSMPKLKPQQEDNLTLQG